MNMKDPNPFAYFDHNVTDLLEHFQVPGVDLEELMSAQGKNIKAIQNAQEVAYQAIQQFVTFQTDLFKNSIDHTNQFLQTMVASETPEEKLSKQADLVKKSYDQTVKNLNNMNILISKSTLKSCDMVNDRVSESLSELKKTVDKVTAHKRKKA